MSKIAETLSKIRRRIGMIRRLAVLDHVHLTHLFKLRELDSHMLEMMSGLRRIGVLNDVADLQKQGLLNDKVLSRIKELDRSSWASLQSSIAYQGKEVVAQGFEIIHDKVRNYTLTGWASIFALFEATRYIVRNRIPGVFVECGVWRGGSMMAAALTLKNADCTDRNFYLFDTFEGVENMPTPDVMDIERTTGKPAYEALKGYNIRDASLGHGTIDDVLANMRTTGYPMDRIHTIKGMVEETLPNTETGPIALLRLDTDWYSSTKAELEHLYPKLSPGGILIIDDYGHFEGAHIAVDEYFNSIDNAPLLQRVDYAVRLAIKPN